MLKGETIAYVAPTFDLCKYFFLELLKYLPESIIETQNKSELYVSLLTGGSIKFLSGEALNSFRGRKFHVAIIDEAAFIPDLENAWYNSIRACLSDYQGSAIFISTPHGKNFFFSLFEKGKQRIDGFESFHFRSIDNPYFPAAEWEAAKASLPEASFNQEYRALPGENADNPFGTSNINANIIPTLSTSPTVCIGIDPARTHDFTAIIGVDADGNQTMHQKFKAPWEVTKQRIRELPSEILKIIDSTGAGSVIHEQLQAECQNLIGYTFTNTSKTELIYKLIKEVETGKVKYVQEVADEMHVFQYRYSSTGILTFSAQSGYHDDLIVAYSLANFHRHQAIQTSNWSLWSA
jgi:hypothetical protein